VLGELPDLGPSLEETFGQMDAYLMSLGEQFAKRTPLVFEGGIIANLGVPEGRFAEPGVARPLMTSANVQATDQPIAPGEPMKRRDEAFDRHVSVGNDEFTQGRFYEAAAQYEAAQTDDSSNAVPAMGATLAYLGAGEVHRASAHLRRALTIFTRLPEVGIDMDRVLGKQMTDARLAQLEQRLAAGPGRGDRQLLFLVTWMHANRGQAEQAVAWATKLRPLATGDSALEAYAKAVIAANGLTGTAPAAAPATTR
jgi:hypothetical protein